MEEWGEIEQAIFENERDKKNNLLNSIHIEIEKENGAVKTAVEENEARPVPTWLEKEEGKL